MPRTSGILLHPTSLPGPHGCGDLGAGAYRFVDWLVQAGQALWQVLPLGVTGAGNSPYASPSAFAGNPLLVDLHELHARGWLAESDLAPNAGLHDGRIDYSATVPYRMHRLQAGAQRFFATADAAARAEFEAFAAAQRDWLDDFALFMALSEANGWVEWTAWEEALVQRDPQALARARREHAERIAFWSFGQWCFFRQWAALRAYANARGVRIVGDAPIFVGRHSADVWAHQSLFELGGDGRPTVVAGVPPDYFSATGQRWGNPLYRWDAHAAEGFGWWQRRLRALLAQVDVVRIDHFRGFAGYWAIPADEPTAMHGHWRPGPGAALFEALQCALGPLPVIAEDLGLITPDVPALRRQFGLPGMRVLQFAFGGDAANPFLPHHHTPDSVVYPGTHDNDTCVGWWHAASAHEREFAGAYLRCDGADIAGAMVRAALGSVAGRAMVALQDVFGLDSRARMNFPGQSSGWWAWRARAEQFDPARAHGLAALGRLYDRAPPHPG